jgi:serine/threonine-protein kinase
LAEQLRAGVPNDPTVLADLMGYYVVLGERDDAVSLIETVAPMVRDDENLMARIGIAYEQIGERELALRYIGDAVRHRYPVRLIQTEPFLGELRADPRYKQLIQEIEVEWEIEVPSESGDQ